MELTDPSLLETRTFIGGEWITGKAFFDVKNPTDGSVIARVADMGVADAKVAISAAKTAQKKWAAKTGKDRAALLRKWYELICDNVDDLALILTSEMGKPLSEARGEILYGAEFIEWFSEEAKRIYGDIIPGHQPDARIMVLKQPVGVVGAITPWNFPNAMIARKVAPALAVGCTFIVRPSELTPLSALALAVLAERAGIPKGVFNVLPCANPQEIGAELCTNPDVAKITFTGSTRVGKILMRQSADTIKKLSLELGGNAPFIVFDDADIEDAVAGAIASKFRNAGQTCVCSNRIFVQESIYDIFIEKLTTAVTQLHIGNGLSPQSIIGPLIDNKAAESVCSMVDEALNTGATLYCGGKRVDGPGNFIEPTVLGNVNRNMRVFKEEIFGPVAALSKFSDEHDAITKANDTEFGLAAYFYTRDIGRIWRVCEALEYGIVGVNEGIVSTEVAPFGGIKQSGNGREGSKYGLDDYVEIKYVCMGGIDK